MRAGLECAALLALELDAKIGASTRATASLFALRHGLLPEERLAG